VNGGEQQNVSYLMKKYFGSEPSIVSVSLWERAGVEGAQLTVEAQIRNEGARGFLALRRQREYGTVSPHADPLPEGEGTD
jgi:hypothetical protein